jgi:CheY-like chemotaxis protein
MIETTAHSGNPQSVESSVPAKKQRTFRQPSQVSIGAEQRTYLNNLLDLAKRLADNTEHTLSPRQIDYAQTIYALGTHLLAISTQLDHDGRSALRSANYRGAKNRCTDQSNAALQQAIPSEPSSDRRAVPRGGGELAGKTLLIVDPNMADVYRLTAVLELQGINTHHAACANSGARLLQKLPAIDMVLLGATPAEPELNGRIQRLRSSSVASQSVPVIVMTPEPEAVDLCSIWPTGALDTLAKPIRNDKLLALLHAWIGTPK